MGSGNETSVLKVLPVHWRNFSLSQTANKSPDRRKVCLEESILLCSTTRGFNQQQPTPEQLPNTEQTYKNSTYNHATYRQHPPQCRPLRPAQSRLPLPPDGGWAAW